MCIPFLPYLVLDSMTCWSLRPRVASTPKLAKTSWVGLAKAPSMAATSDCWAVHAGAVGDNWDVVVGLGGVGREGT